MQTFHIAYELGGAQAVEALPGGPQWLAVIQATPEHERHLAVHTGHLLHLNDADTAAWNAGAHTLLEHATLTGTASQVRTRVEDLSGAGVTEIVYQPTGDIPANSSTSPTLWVYRQKRRRADERTPVAN